MTALPALAPSWRRWRDGLAISLFLHLAVILALVIRLHDQPPSEPPSLSVEVLAAPPAPAPQPKPQPQPQPSKPQPRPQPPAPQKPVFIPRATTHNDVVIPPPPQHPADPTHKPPPMEAPVEQASAVQKAPEDRVATAAVGDPNAPATWESAVVAKLEAAKRYPASARFAREEATILARFTVDRQGKVLKSDLVRPSGMEDLDEEVLALLHRVRLPPPPAVMADSDLTLTVPIEFSITTQ